MNEIFPDVPVEIAHKILDACSAKDTTSIRSCRKSIYADNDLRIIAFTKFVGHQFWTHNLKRVEPKLAGIVKEFRASVTAEEHHEEQANNILKDLI